MMWNIVDWDTSIAKATLDLASQGAYRNLIDKLYMSGGQLLNQDVVLMLASGSHSMDDWLIAKASVMQFFVISDDTLFIAHHRVSEQIKNVAKLSRRRQVLGKLGAKLRWGKKLEENTKDSKGNGSAIDLPLAKPCPMSSSSSTSSSITKDQKLKSASRFSKPCLAEVTAYCLERNNQINPQKFIDHYEARGWIYNRGVVMKDWRAAIRTWEGNGNSNGKQSGHELSKTQQRTERNREAILVGLGFKEETGPDARLSGQDDQLRASAEGIGVVGRRALKAVAGDD